MFSFEQFANHLAPLAMGLPQAAWWLALFIMLILGLTAAIDAATARVPDPLLLIGVAATLVTDGLYGDWPFAGQQLALGLLVCLVGFGVNEIWYRFYNHDAIGMGDVKWSALATMNFGLPPVMFAWVIGAWLGCLWLGGLWLWRKIRKQTAPTRLHFAPFLFFGLIAGLYWLYWR